MWLVERNGWDPLGGETSSRAVSAGRDSAWAWAARWFECLACGAPVSADVLSCPWCGLRDPWFGADAANITKSDGLRVLRWSALIATIAAVAIGTWIIQREGVIAGVILGLYVLPAGVLSVVGAIAQLQTWHAADE